MVTTSKRLTATGDVPGTENGGMLHAVTVFHSAAANAIIREGGAGGAIIATVGCAAGLSETVRFNGRSFTGPLHATLSAGEVTVEY